MSYVDDEEIKMGDINQEEDLLDLDDDLSGPMHDDFLDDEEDLEGIADINGSEY